MPRIEYFIVLKENAARQVDTIQKPTTRWMHVNAPKSLKFKLISLQAPPLDYVRLIEQYPEQDIRYKYLYKITFKMQNQLWGPIPQWFSDRSI